MERAGGEGTAPDGSSGEGKCLGSSGIDACTADSSFERWAGVSPEPRREAGPPVVARIGVVGRHDDDAADGSDDRSR
jgi:hypothetical protein